MLSDIAQRRAQSLLRQRNLLALASATLALVATVAISAAVSAPPDLDLSAIRARAKAATSDAEALAATARLRAMQLADDARSVEAGAVSAQAGYMQSAKAMRPAKPSGPFDFDALVAGISDAERASLRSAPRFIAFASLSMPKEALRAMLRDVPAAGGTVVFRGLPGGNVRAFTSALAAVVEPGKRLDGVGIDLICPPLSGPETMIVWTMKGTTNAEQEAQAGRDHREAA